MEENKKELSNKIMTIVGMILACIAIILSIIFMIFRQEKNNNKNIIEENKIIENIIEEKTNISNEVNNETNDENLISEEKQEIDEEPVLKEVIEVTNLETEEERKDKAIDIAIEDWGGETNTSFQCNSIDAEGKYVIDVIDKQTSTTKCRYHVDVDTKDFYIED